MKQYFIFKLLFLIKIYSMQIKNTILMLTALLISIIAIAQPALKQQRTIGGTAEDIFESMALTADGGFIAGGISASPVSGNKSEDSKGLTDYWIVKYDSLGNIEWDKTVGSSGDDLLFSLQQTADDGYILGGESAASVSGDKTEGSYGDNDFWIVKLDAAGNIAWNKTFGGSSFENFRALQQTKDGGYILGGSSYSNASGTKTEDSRGETDFWIVKINATGDVQWDKRFGGTSEDELQSLQQTEDGGFILGGYSFSRKGGDKTEPNFGANDYWVVKTDGNGNKQWDKTIGGASTENLHCIKQVADGGYILGGASNSGISGNKTAAQIGGEDYWLVKLNSTGDIIWNKTIGGTGNDELYTLRQTTDGGYILAGSSFSNISADKTESCRGKSDYWIVKTDTAGSVQWDKTIGGNDDDYCFSIYQLNKNNYLIGGFSASDISGDKTNNSIGVGYYDRDYWILHLRYKVPSVIAVTTFHYL